MRTVVITLCQLSGRARIVPVRLATPDLGGKLSEGAAGIRRPEYGCPRDEQPGPPPGPRPGRLRVDPAVPLDVDVVADEPPQAPDPVERARDELLAAPPGVHRHAERLVDLDLGVDAQRRRGVDGEAGAAAGLADVLEREVDVRRRLGVDRDRPRPRLSERGDLALRALDHEVHV